MTSRRQGSPLGTLRGDAGVPFEYSEEPMTRPTNFRRIAKIVAFHVRPKGEGHGCPETKMPFDLEMELDRNLPLYHGLCGFKRIDAECFSQLVAFLNKLLIPDTLGEHKRPATSTAISHGQIEPEGRVHLGALSFVLSLGKQRKDKNKVIITECYL